MKTGEVITVATDGMGSITRRTHPDGPLGPLPTIAADLLAITNPMVRSVPSCKLLMTACVLAAAAVDDRVAAWISADVGS